LLNIRAVILMKIIYVYNKKPKLVIMAAYAHLKLDIHENLKYIDIKYRKEGYFCYLGIDEDLNEIYLLYSNKRGPILKNLLNGIAHICNEEVKVIDLEKK